MSARPRLLDLCCGAGGTGMGYPFDFHCADALDVNLEGFDIVHASPPCQLYESNVPLTAPAHPAHIIPASRAGHWTPGTIMSVSGHIAPIAHARTIMGIDWTTREELAEAIPPAYTQYVGTQLLAAIRAAA